MISFHAAGSSSNSCCSWLRTCLKNLGICWRWDILIGIFHHFPRFINLALVSSLLLIVKLLFGHWINMIALHSLRWIFGNLVGVLILTQEITARSSQFGFSSFLDFRLQWLRLLTSLSRLLYHLHHWILILCIRVAEEMERLKTTGSTHYLIWNFNSRRLDILRLIVSIRNIYFSLLCRIWLWILRLKLLLRLFDKLVDNTGGIY